MAVECPGCQARVEEIAYLRAQVKELTDLAMANANPALHLSLKNPQGTNEPATTHFDDGFGQTYVMYEGKAVKKQDLEQFLAKAGGYIDGNGRYIPADEWERVNAKLDEIMGARSPEPPQ